MYTHSKLIRCIAGFMTVFVPFLGPFWTDYAVLEESEASMNTTHPLTSFVQIVGSLTFESQSHSLL